MILNTYHNSLNPLKNEGIEVLHNGMDSILVRAILETVEDGLQHIHTVVELHGIGDGRFNLTNSLRPILRKVTLFNYPLI